MADMDEHDFADMVEQTPVRRLLGLASVQLAAISAITLTAADSGREVRGRISPLGLVGALTCTAVGESPEATTSRRWSLAFRRLPKFYLVSFWIDDPGKLPVLGIVDLLENVAAFLA